MEINLRNESGQATVELAILIPIILIIAFIAINALLFFGYCASFDRTFRQTISSIGSSPAASESIADIKAHTEAILEKSFNKENTEFNVSVIALSGDLKQFSATIKMYPTLFGLGLKREIFGVRLPSLNHECQMTIDVYKPGVVL